MVGKADQAMSKGVNGTIINQLEGQSLEHYHRELLRYSFQLTRNYTEAEDIVQETFYRCLKMKHMPDMVKSVSGYLRVVARHVFLDKAKKENTSSHISIDDEHNKSLSAQLIDDVSSKVIENNLYYKELMTALPTRVLMNGLTEREFRILYLKSVEELTPNEIAEELGEEPTLVKYDLQKLLAKVRYRCRTVMPVK